MVIFVFQQTANSLIFLGLARLFAKAGEHQLGAEAVCRGFPSAAKCLGSNVLSSVDKSESLTQIAEISHISSLADPLGWPHEP